MYIQACICAGRLVREYLELEFRNPRLPFPFSVERIIDDFVMMCMMAGNDFLPGNSVSHLVSMPCIALHCMPATSKT